MRRDGWPTLCIHGDKNQGERDWVLNGKGFSIALAYIGAFGVLRLGADFESVALSSRG